MQRYINRDGIYSRDDTSPGYSLHSTDSSLPTFSISSADIHEALILGQEIMRKNNFDELCIVEQDTLAFYHIKKLNGDISVKLETGLDVEGPLYGMNLSSSY